MKHLTLLLTVLCTLAFMLAATSCATDNLTDRQLYLSQAGLAAAEIGLNVAEVELASKLGDPNTPAWQTLVAQQSVDLARRELIKARTRLEQAEAERAAARLAAAQQPPKLDTTASK